MLPLESPQEPNDSERSRELGSKGVGESFVAAERWLDAKHSRRVQARQPIPVRRFNAHPRSRCAVHARPQSFFSRRAVRATAAGAIDSSTSVLNRPLLYLVDFVTLCDARLF